MEEAIFTSSGTSRVLYLSQVVWTSILWLVCEKDKDLDRNIEAHRHLPRI